MAIDFKCLKCGGLLTADSASAGLEARCPSCGHVMKVPSRDKTADSDRQLTTLEDLEADLLASSPSPPPPEPPVDLQLLADDDLPQPPRPRQAATPPARGASRGERPAQSAAPDDEEDLDEVEVIDESPEGAPVEPAATLPPALPPRQAPPPAWQSPPPPLPAPAPPPPALPQRGVSLGQYVIDCLKAIGFGFANLPNVLILVLMTAFLSVIVGAVSRFLMGVAGDNLGMRWTITIGGILTDALLYGYAFRYMLDLASATIEGGDTAPFLPQWTGEVFTTFVRMLGLVLVYVAPIVTIPLLPLGVLGLAYANDGRAFNVIWAIRAAIKRPLQLFMLWIMMGIWLLATITAVVAIMFIVLMCVGHIETKAGAITLMIGIALLVLSLVVLFGVMQHRCIGLLGRDYPELLEMMPQQHNATVSMGFVAGALVAGLLLRGVWIEAGTYMAKAARKQQEEQFAFGGATTDKDVYEQDEPMGVTFTPSTPTPLPTPAPTPWYTPGPRRTPDVSFRTPPPMPAPTFAPIVVRTAAPTPAPDDEALRLQLADRFQKIHQAVADYAASHDGRLPMSLGTLVAAGGLDDATRRNPFGGLINMEPGQKFNPASDDILAFIAIGSKYSIVTHGGNTETLDLSQFLERMRKQRAAAGTAIRRTPSPGQEELFPRPRTAASSPAASGLTVAWDMPDWPTIKYDRYERNPHPFAEFCQVLKEVKADNFKAVAGVEVGPAAKDRTDKAYLDFKAQVLERYIAMIAKDKGLGQRKDMVQKFGDIDYDRSFCFKSSMWMASVMTSVEHGRCVAYWFDGNTATFVKLTGSGLNKVTARE